MQGSTLSVQSVSLLLPPSPSRLNSGPQATVLRLMLFLMLLSDVSFTQRHVLLNIFSDSPSGLSTPSSPLPYLIPKSISDTQFLLNLLSESKVVHFQWIPGHSFLPGNNLADSLANVGASLDPFKISVSLLSLISSHRLSLYTSFRVSI